MLSLGSKGSRPRDRPPDPSRITQGLEGHTHRVCSCVPSGQGCRPSPGTPATSVRGSGTLPSLRLPSGESRGRSLAPSWPSVPVNARAREGAPCATEARGAPRRCPTGVALSTTPPTGSRMGRDARRQTPPLASRDRGLLGPPVRPSSRQPSPPRSLQKVHLREVGPSQHSLTLSVLEQSSRTTPRASSGPRYHHGPQNAATRSS